MKGRVSISIPGLIAVLVILVVVGLVWYTSAKADEPFLSCAQAKAAGHSSIPKGSPYYNPGLDRDKDNLACE